MKTENYYIAKEVRAIARDYWPKVEKYLGPYRVLKKGRIRVLTENQKYNRFPCSRCGERPQYLVILSYANRRKGLPRKHGRAAWVVNTHQRCVGPDGDACRFRMSVR